MPSGFPIEIRFQLIETLCHVFYYKKPLIQFLNTMQIPQSTFSQFVTNLNITTKRDALNQLFDDLLKLSENEGLGCLNRILYKLSNWSYFAHSEDPKKAQTSVNQLAALLQNSVKQREHLKNEKDKREQEVQKQRSLHDRITSQEKLRDRYYELLKASNPQQRGLNFERELLQDIFEFEGLNSTEPFKLQGEQIDGAFEFDTEHYLVESKWKKDKATPEEVSWFKTKVERRLSGTRGLMISINGFSDEAVRTARESRCVILMDGDDLHYILELSNDLTFRSIFQRKIAEFSLKSNPYFTARQILLENSE